MFGNTKNLFLYLFCFSTVVFKAQSLQFKQLPPLPPYPSIIANFEGVESSSSAFADIDNDGDLDAIMAGFSNKSLRITKLYKNDGIGNFSEASGTNFPGISRGSLAFADLDGDQDPDLIMTGMNSSSLPITKLYFNDGIGNFTEKSTTIIPVLNSYIAFEDIDNDNDQDLLVTGYNSPGSLVAKLYENDGNGNFTEVTGTPFTAVFGSSVAFADIDNDNDKDVVISGVAAGNVATTRVYKNAGGQNFVFASSLYGIEDGDIDLADIDNDNDVDLLIVGEDSTMLYLNDGNGGFSSVSNPFIHIDRFRCAVAFTDVDLDSDLDVIISGYGYDPAILFDRNMTKLYLNDGMGNFSESTSNNFKGVRNGSISIGDVDSDNDPDILLTGEFSKGKISRLYLNNSNGVFDEVTGDHFVGGACDDVAFGDIDNDNDLDALICGGEQSLLYNNDGNGGYTLVAGTPFIGVSDGSVSLADVDNDNDLDVLVTGNGRISSILSGRARLYKNTGTGSFTLAQTLQGFSNSSSEFADVDNDNDQDLIIIGRDNSNAISTTYYLNNGNGFFTKQTGTPFHGAYGDIEFADIDNDGDKDVLIAGNSQHQTRLYKNDGLGGFTEVMGTSFISPTDATVCFGDIDNDKDLDLIIAGGNFVGNSEVIELYLNDSLGNFTLQTGLPFSGVKYPSIDLDDVNNDGYPDLLISGKASHDLQTYLYLNDTAGSFFLYRQDILKGLEKSTVAFADIDQDSDLDIFLAGKTVNNDLAALLYKNIDCFQAFEKDSISNCISYTWPVNNITYTESGLYSDTIRNVTGCDTVFYLNLTLTPVDTGVLRNDSSLTALDTGVTYQWLNCNNGYKVIQGQTNRNFIPSSSGNYAVIINRNGCIDTSSCYQFNKVGLENNTKNNFIQIYPNPVSEKGDIYIKTDFNIYELIKVEVYDIVGAKIDAPFKLLSKDQIHLNLQGPKGIYYINFFLENKSYTGFRVIKN